MYFHFNPKREIVILVNKLILNINNFITLFIIINFKTFYINLLFFKIRL